MTFVWRPEVRATAPSVYTAAIPWSESQRGLLSLGVGGVWYRSVRLSNRTRASYGFSLEPLPAADATVKQWARYGKSIRPDPLNSRRFTLPRDPDDPSDSAIELSLLELHRTPPARWTRGGRPFRGTEEHVHLPSRYLRGTRSVWVFAPEGFDPKSARYRLLIVFDGIVYRDAIPVPRIVQKLVDAGRIPLTVVVLVGNAPGARVKELEQNPSFARFLTRELLPWLRQRYGLRATGARTIVAGSSLGGVAAAYAALHYPRRFGNVLAQSGAFLWFAPTKGAPSTSLMEEFARAPKLPLRFYLDAGTLESEVPPNAATSLRASVRHLRDVLLAKGYPVVHAEFEGGHDYACWRETFAEGLLSLLAPARAGRS